MPTFDLLTITVPSDKVAEMTDIVASVYRYSSRKNEGETKGQFIQRIIKEDFRKEVVKRSKVRKRIEQHGNAVPDVGDGDIT